MNEQTHRRGFDGTQLICRMAMFATAVGAGSTRQGSVGGGDAGGGPRDKVKPHFPGPSILMSTGRFVDFIHLHYLI